MNQNVIFGAGEWDDEQHSDVFDLLARPAWHRRAACRGSDPSLFFPERGEDTKHVKAICAACPVKDECLEAGLREPVGLWGGVSERSRRKLRGVRYRALAVCGTDSGYFRHRRLGTEPCTPCRDAHADSEFARHARKSEQRSRTQNDRLKRLERRQAGFCVRCANCSHGECRGKGCACTVCAEKIAQLPADHAVMDGLESDPVVDSAGVENGKAEPLGEPSTGEAA
jgi:WhiB family redox-sensing transcriptional regulator